LFAPERKDICMDARDELEVDRALKTKHRAMWARDNHVKQLLGNGVKDVVTQRDTVTVDRFRRPRSSVTTSKRTTVPPLLRIRPTPRNRSASPPWIENSSN
jgi:hypothetical protein